MTSGWLAAAAGTAFGIANLLVAVGLIVLAALFVLFAMSLWRPKHLARLVNIGLPTEAQARLKLLGQEIATTFGADEGDVEQVVALWDAIDALEAKYEVLVERINDVDPDRGVPTRGEHDW